MRLLNLKSLVLGLLAAAGSTLAWLLGGWNSALQALLVLMAIDLISGLSVALIFKNSTKTVNGAAESNVCFKGLLRKVAILLAVTLAVQLDRLMGDGQICRNTVIFFFVGNEGLSIIENLALMGVPMPQMIKNALEVLQKKNKE